MDCEIPALKKMGMWITVLHPLDKNIVGSKWVFHIKCKADGSIDKYKAWLIAQSFTQVYWIDYFVTFSPVTKLSSFWLILAVTVLLDWDIESFDFNGTYPNGELQVNKEIYMFSLPGYNSNGSMMKCLHKSLYGLKQAGQKWYNALWHTLANLGFSVSQADPGCSSPVLARTLLFWLCMSITASSQVAWVS